MSEADRTQLPYFQAFILSTKNIIITDGGAVGYGRKNSFLFLSFGCQPQHNLFNLTIMSSLMGYY